MKFFRPSPIGVDLGSGSVKVVQVRGKKISLAAFLDLTEETKSYESVLIKTLSDFFKGLRITGMPAAVQVSGAIAFIRALTFPPMPMTELKEAIQWEVRRQIPYPFEDAVIDYTASGTSEGIAVTFACAERRSIEKHVDTLRASGLNIVAVDVSPLCLIRAIGPMAAGNVIVVDIGSSVTEINIMKAGALRITRTVELGGQSIKNHLKEAGYSDEEAERILIEGEEEQLSGALGELLKEFSRSIDYYRANFKEKTFAEVILSGGVSMNPAVKEHISHALDMPARVPDPFEGLALEDEAIRKLGPRFSVALGLAERTA